MVKKKAKKTSRDEDDDDLPFGKKTSELAIFSLVVSLAGVFFPYAPIIGIVLGFLALNQIKKEPERYEGKSMAQAGIIVGFILLGIKVLFLVIYLILAVLLLSLPFFFIDPAVI